MIELDGIEYAVKTPAENTQDLVDYVNQYCVDNNITNTEDEVIFIEVNVTNPIYLLFWAMGYMATVIQKLLYSIGKQYSIAASSEQQLLNIATNAGVRRHQPTYTTIRALVYAGSAGACVITTDLQATVTVDGKNYRFHPTFGITISADESSVIVLSADILGALSIDANTVVEFDTDVENFDHMVSAASVPGRELESIPALRRRIQRVQDASSNLDRLVQALRGLDGITACSVVYNTNPTDPIVVGTLSIPARHTALFVQGYNADIAETYFKYTDRPSTDDTGSITQNYQLLNGQTFPVYILPPVSTPVFIQIYTYEEVTDAVKDQIREAIISIAIDLDIGSRLTTADILEKMIVSFKVVGALISLEEEGTYSYSVQPDSNALLQLLAANISVEVGS